EQEAQRLVGAGLEKGRNRRLEVGHQRGPNHLHGAAAIGGGESTGGRFDLHRGWPDFEVIGERAWKAGRRGRHGTATQGVLPLFAGGFGGGDAAWRRGATLPSPTPSPPHKASQRGRRGVRCSGEPTNRRRYGG